MLGHLDLLERDGLVRAVERDDGVVTWARSAPVSGISSSSVTGPSLTSSTSIIAPKTPRCASSRAQKRS